MAGQSDMAINTGIETNTPRPLAWGGGFNYPQGAGGLVQATNGALYGTTWGGGAYGNGARRHIVEQRAFQRRCDALSALARPNAYGHGARNCRDSVPQF